MTNIPKIWIFPTCFAEFVDYEQPRVVKHFIADSTRLSGILDEWARKTQFGLPFFFFSWEKTPLRLISIYLWYSFNRKISGISALMILFPAKHTRFEFLNEYIVTIDFNLRRWHLKVKKMTLY